ncbi:MAG: UDP-N-acetylmuramoyl-L-alanine--D-glutamate ligase [Nitriliruptoraceae bacterium]
MSTQSSRGADRSVPQCALVVGSGVSARAAVRLLRRDGIRTIVVVPETDGPEPDWLDPDDVELRRAGAGTDPLTADVDVLIPSPGVPPSDPIIQAATDAGVAVWSEPELAYRQRPRRVVAVTGTNGKTSTVELVTAMFTQDGRAARSCGNIGFPLCDAVLDADEDVVLVAELSSFQLAYTSSLRADVATLLNVAPDHLDWHGTFAAYAGAKARIWRGQQPGDWSVVNADDSVAVALGQDARARHAAFSVRDVVDRGIGVRDDTLVVCGDGDTRELLTISSLPETSRHHVANVAAAATTAHLAGIADAAVCAAARDYTPGDHRGRLVTEWKGVRYIDDSKATNPHAAAAALAASGSTVWIAGGLAKGVDLASLGGSIGDVRHAVLIGSAADALAEICAQHGVQTSRATTMDDAVQRAACVAHPGDTVLLAPACASFDQFRDFRDRGEQFADAVRRLGNADRSPRMVGS